MGWSMKQKPDTEKQNEDQAAGLLVRPRLRKMMALLETRPELFESLEALVNLAANDTAEGPLRSAEEVEKRVVETTRALGRETIKQWAQQAQERAVADCQAEHPRARVKKKAR